MNIKKNKINIKLLIQLRTPLEKEPIKELKSPI